MLEIANLAVTRGDRRLFTGLDFSLQNGELLFVNGPNGSGKTTLLRMLCGLVMADDGEVRWNGQNIRTLGDEYLAELFYLGHLNAIKDEMTAVENLRIAGTLAGQDVSEQAALAALDRIGLRGFEDFPAKLLSQGQKRRVALSRLLLTKARLWVLDEPFVALDAASLEVLRAIFSGHLANEGIIVLTTHQQVTIDTITVKQIKLGA